MNPLFESFQRKNGNIQVPDFNSALQNLAKQITSVGMTPEQIVRQKIQNGEMSQAQFEQLGRLADMILGRR